MTFKIIDKTDVMKMLDNEDLYLLRLSSRNGTIKYCSSKQAISLKLKEVMSAIHDENVAFIEIKEES